jgi:hypothetical protein
MTRPLRLQLKYYHKGDVIKKVIYEVQVCLKLTKVQYNNNQRRKYKHYFPSPAAGWCGVLLFIKPGLSRRFLHDSMYPISSTSSLFTHHQQHC